MHSIQARSDSPGDVPARWSLQSLGALISLEYGAGLPETVRSGDTFPVYGSSGQVGGHERPLVAGPGIIVGRKGSIGSVTWSQAPFWPIDTTYYVVLKSQQVALRWCYWLLHFLPLETLNSATGVPGLNRLDAYGLPVRLPPLPEQQCIAATLDRIEAHIQSSEQLIAKLKLVKKGLLHELLTCGIDAHGQVRDPLTHPELFQESPLGRIPKEWRVLQFGSLIESITSGSRGWAAYYAPEGALFLRIGNLTREHVHLRLDEVIRVKPPPGAEGSRTRVQPGDVLISITADLGITGVIPADLGEAYVNQHIALVRLNGGIDPSYVANYLAGEQAQEQFYWLNDIGAKAGLNLPTIARLLIILPSRLQEQRAIARAIDAHDARIASEEAHVGKLRQVRQALMDDLFTGRVRIQAMEETETARAESERG